MKILKCDIAMTMTQCESVLYCSTYLSESVCVSVRVPPFSLYACLCACDMRVCVPVCVRRACVFLQIKSQTGRSESGIWFKSGGCKGSAPPTWASTRTNQLQGSPPPTGYSPRTASTNQQLSFLYI